MAAFDALSPYRVKLSYSLGMAGGVILPEPIPLETIRQEGVRRHYRGEELEDFCKIVQGIDHAFLMAEHIRINGSVKAGLAKLKKG
jgi:hypothetical protein